jgi:hypothetical protein
MKAIAIALAGFGLATSLSSSPAQAVVAIDNTSGLSAVNDSTARTLGLFVGNEVYWLGANFSTGTNPSGYNLESFTAFLSQPSGNPATAGNDIDLRLAVYSVREGFPDQELASVALADPVSTGYVTYDNLGILDSFVLQPSTPYSLVVQAFNPNPTISLTAWYRLPFNTAGFPGYASSDGFSYLGNFQSANAGASWYSIPDALLYRLEASPFQASASVPGPLPIFGAAAAFGFSRKLKKRIQSSIESVSGSYCD